MKPGTLAIAAVAIAAAGSASAQRAPRPGVPPAPAAQPTAPGTPQQPQYTLSNGERAALAPLMTAYNAAVAAGDAGDWAPVQALLPAAAAAAQGNDARYLVARIQLALAIKNNDSALKMTALDALIASPLATPEELPRYLHARGELAFAAEDFAGAERVYQRLLELTPGDERVVGNLAVVRRRMGNPAGALDEIHAMIATQEAAGGAAEESLYRRARDSAYAARDRRAADYALRLARFYPTPANWRDAISVQRSISGGSTPAALALDALRLSRVTGALSGSNDYLAFAQMLEQAGLPGEAKAVLDEGISRGQIRTGDPAATQMLTTAARRITEDRSGLEGQIAQARSAQTGRLARAVGDALYGYGRYREAADLYRAAMSKTGEDRDLLGLRLGAALVMAGDRAGAEAALGTVTGPAADLARLWLAWVTRRTG